MDWILSIRGARIISVPPLRYNVHDADGLFLGVIPRSVLSYARKHGFVITPFSGDTKGHEAVGQSVLLEPSREEASKDLQEVRPLHMGEVREPTDG